MFLKQLTIVNFKNLIQKDFRFTERINCFVGQNGVGKTNVLDSIYSLSMTKSYFNSVSSQNINYESDFFMLQGSYEALERQEKIVCSLKKGQKKVIKRNSKIYEKVSDHIGLIPVVIVSPADRDLIVEGSETRRKFIDGVISQMNQEFFHSSIQYKKAIAQRNALLKYFAANRNFDELSLAAFDEQLIKFGVIIHRERKAFLDEFVGFFLKYYRAISGKNEQVNLIYKSQLNEADFADVLRESLSKDRMVQHSTAGVHKDDLLFEMHGYPIKKFGSQGQQKTFLVALKLAQYDFLSAHSKSKPILLLDDIFDKLDDQRVAQLIQLVSGDRFGQIFISDTHDQRTEEVVKRADSSYEIFNLSDE